SRIDPTSAGGTGRRHETRSYVQANPLPDSPPQAGKGADRARRTRSFHSNRSPHHLACDRDLRRRHAIHMSADLPFDKRFDLAPETVEEVAPCVGRLLATNPGPFTFKGTVPYMGGRGQVAVIDPGPLDEPHIAALLDAVRGEPVTHIFVPHTHRDHSPAVPRIKAATGAVVLAEGAHRPARPLNIGEALRLDASNDTEFRPDRTLADGEDVAGAGWTTEAAAPPRHTAP